MRPVTVVCCVVVWSISPAVGWAQEADDPESVQSPTASSTPDLGTPGDQPATFFAGQKPDSRSFWAPFAEIPRDFVRFGSFDSLKIVGLGAAGAAGAHRWDDGGIAHAQRHMPANTYRAGNVGGNFYFQTGSAFGLYAIARMSGSNRTAALGADLLRAQILTQGIVQAGKITTQRTRPDGSNDYSLPSGHAASAFATASVLHRHFGWVVGVPAYAFGAYVGAARMSANRHHLSDVIMGAAVGIAAGRTVTVGHGKTRFAMGVSPTSGGAAVTFSKEGR